MESLLAGLLRDHAVAGGHALLLSATLGAGMRTREYLTEAEVEKLMKAANGNRYGHRDATMVLVAYRHGLRAAELVDLRWDQVDFRSATLHVRRVKQGTPSAHPIVGDELRALRRLQREQEPKFTLCVHFGAGDAVHHSWLRSDDRAGGASGEARLQAASSHAKTCLRLCLGQQGT
jgi:integrase